MRTYRGKGPKILLLLIVCILIGGFSIGFAALSKSLLISSYANVTPESVAKSITVKFSSDPDTLETNDIVATKSSGNVTASDAKIDNSLIPTISNFSVGLAEPGDSAEYVFYALNEGTDDAYLTSITFNNVSGKSSNKHCSPIAGVDSSTITAVCENIKLTLTVGNTETSENKTLTGHVLKGNSSEQITVKVEFLSTDASILASSNDFRVQFGDITLLYSTVDGDIGNLPGVEGGTTTLAQHITNLYTPNSTVVNNGITYNIDTTNGIIDDGLGGTVASGGNLRYYGANPDNYIDIGDRDENDNPILWRIIGVFETKYATETQPCNVDSNGDGHFDNCASDKLVKIIRDESIGSYSWDDKMVNDWSTASLNTYLNISTYYPNLNTNVKSKIENTLWNLGGTDTSEIYSNEMYDFERGTTRYNTDRPTEWVGKVGLMYPSDYGYATDLTKCSENLENYDSSTNSYACRTNDWLYNSADQWTITPDSSFWTDACIVLLSGYVDNNYMDTETDHGVRPVLYLKSDVSITGEGTTTEGINYKIVE